MQLANVIDLDAYRVRRDRAREVATPFFPWPGAWVMVWFAPVILVQPYLGGAVR